jgi:hypothetical protein
MSKGSNRRPENNDKFRENFDRIFRKENKGPDTNKRSAGTQDQTTQTNNSSPTRDAQGV